MGLDPRVGFAYQLNSKTVLRGGVAIVYTATATASGVIASSANTSVPGFGQTVGQLKDGIPTQLQPLFPNFNSNATQNPGAIAATTYLGSERGTPVAPVSMELRYPA